jgi:flagellar motor switch protein FliN/FliY
MPEESSPLGSTEIDDLLRQTQAAISGSAPASPAAPAAQSVLAPDELASLLAATTPAEPPAGKAQVEVPESRMAAADMEFLLDQAQQALASVDSPTQLDPLAGLAPFKLEEFGGAPPSSEVATLELIRDVELDLKIELGRTQMYLEDVLKLHKGSVVPLDKLAGDPVDIFVNGRLIARGEVLVLNDNFCVRVAELITAEAG